MTVNAEADAYGAAFLGAPVELRDGPYAWQEALARGGGIYELISPDSPLAGTLEIIAPIEAYDADGPASACSGSPGGATIAGWKDDDICWVPVPGATTDDPGVSATSFDARAEVVVPSSDDDGFPDSPTSFTVGFDTEAPTISSFISSGEKIAKLPRVLAVLTDDAAGVRAASGITVSLGDKDIDFTFDPSSGELVVSESGRNLPVELPVGATTFIIRAEDGFCNASAIDIPVNITRSGSSSQVIYLSIAHK